MQLILGVMYVGIGLSWLWPTAEAAQQQSAVWRDSIAPTYLWGSLWIIVGCSCLIASFIRRLDANWGYGPAGSLMLGWAAIEFLGWISGEVEQGYRPTLIWTGFAALIFATARLGDRPEPMAERVEP